MTTLRDLLVARDMAWWTLQDISRKYDVFEHRTNPPDLVAARQAYRRACDAAVDHPLSDAIHAAGDTLNTDTYDRLMDAISATVADEGSPARAVTEREEA